MKKAILLITTALLIFSCSKETITDENLTVEVDYTKIIDPEVTTPKPIYDNSIKGLYKGVFVSADTQYHGVISINLENDKNINAIIEFDNNDRLGFEGKKINLQLYSFIGKNAQFDLVIGKGNNVTIQNAQIEGLNANSKVVKDISTNRTLVGLGAFVETGNPAFGGTWDLISISSEIMTIEIPIPFPPFIISIDFPAQIISEAVVCFNDGTSTGQLFSDTTMETFTGTSSCTYIPNGVITPFFTGPIDIVLPIVGLTPVDEHAAFDQTSLFGSHVATWSLGYSLAAGGPDRVYIDNDCNIVASGTWSRNGRSGTILFD